MKVVIHNETALPIKDIPLKIVYVKDFNADSQIKFTDDFNTALNTGQTFVPIIIDSFGGSCYSFLDMAGKVLSSPIPVHTVVTGKAMSAGAMLFLLGEERYISPCASMMIHHAAAGVFDKLPDMENSIEHSKDLQDRCFSICAEHLGKTKNWFINRLKEKGNVDWYLNAKEALKEGFATKIGVPTLQVNIMKEYKLI